MAHFTGPQNAKTITARSSSEAEIYSTDECVKYLIRLCLITLYLNKLEAFITKLEPVTIYSDNMVLIYWYKLTTTKGLRNISIRENSIIESVNINLYMPKQSKVKLILKTY